MNKAVIRYRMKFALAALGVGAGVALIGRLLSAGLQPFTWGVAAGQLLTLAIIVAGWLVKGTDPADPVEVRQKIPASSRQAKIATAIALPGGYGIWFVSRFWLPSHTQDMLFGAAIGLLLMVAILFVHALWTSAKSSPQQRKRIAPLEEASSHTMVMPTMMERGDGSPKVP